MNKFMNSAETMLAESLRGFGSANSTIIGVHETPFFVFRKDAPVDGKVAVISGGGSGHEPLHIGYVGRGMLDAACPGEVFTSPTPDQILSACHKVNGGVGVLFVVKNYAGDRMNFEIASEMLDLDHLTLSVTDEAMVADTEAGAERRGIAGTLIVEKIVGAAAEAGFDLDACGQFGVRANQCTRTMGVALTGCMVPAANRPTFNLAENEMEMGVGIHGEAGRKRMEIMNAKDIVHQLVTTIGADLSIRRGDPILLHVNGLGGTPLMELYLIYHLAEKLCRDKGWSVVRSLVGNHTTSLEMAGCSITVSVLKDDLLGLWDAPVHTPSLRWGE